MMKILPTAILSLLVLASCHHVFKEKIRGNGIIKTETRTAGSFTGVDVSGNFDVYIKQDSSATIKIEADENLMEYIIVKTEGDRLVIKPEEGYTLSGSSIKVYVSSPEFKKLEASGSCNIYGENKITSASMLDIDLSGSSDIRLELKSPEVEAELSGAGSIELKGETKDFSVDGSGSTNVKCFDLMAENVEIDISGSGHAEVFASVKLGVKISGSGDVQYKGNASSVTQHISGSGSIKKAE